MSSSLKSFYQSVGKGISGSRAITLWTVYMKSKDAFISLLRVKPSDCGSTGCGHILNL
jgi:hypothetical protein